VADVIFYVFYGIDDDVVWQSKGFRTSYWDEFWEHETQVDIVGILIIVGLLGLAIYIKN